MAERANETITRVGPEDELDRPLVRRSHLYLALDCDRPLRASARVALDGLAEVRIGRGDAQELACARDGGGGTLSLQVPDRRMSGQHARLVREGRRWALADRGSKNGTYVNGVRCHRGVLEDDDVLEFGHTFFLFRSTLMPATDEPIIVRAAELNPPTPELTTLDPALALDFAALARVAGSTVSVLLLGESGTGKEVLARAVHILSGRGGEFVAVNCGALPQNLVEAELFGHRKGAYSGATESRPGLVRTAHRGTLFLDEIGDLPFGAQAKLLRVLQEREVQPVGENRPVAVDFRLVAATNLDLAALVTDGRFRGDLCARISGFTLMPPPLARRRTDLGLLLGILLRRIVGPEADRIRLSFHAARALLLHDWPNNIRELENALVVAVAQSPDRCIQRQHLPDSMHLPPAPPAPRSDDDLRQQLVELLARHGGNVSAVAREMGKTRTQIHRYARRFDIDFEAFRGDREAPDG